MVRSIRWSLFRCSRSLAAGGGNLWIEATAANVQYIVDAFDAIVDAEESREAIVAGPIVAGPAVANPVVAEPSVVDPGVLSGSANVGDA